MNVIFIVSHEYDPLFAVLRPSGTPRPSGVLFDPLGRTGSL
jgi:hypothetical protein